MDRKSVWVVNIEVGEGREYLTSIDHLSQPGKYQRVPVVEPSVLFQNLSAKRKASIEALYDRIPNIKIAEYKML